MFFPISSFYFFYFASVGVYIIFLPKVLLDIGYNPTEIGIIMAIGPLMRFITPFFFLKHFELTPNLFKTSLIITVITTLSFYLTLENFWLFLLSNTILGITLSFQLPFIESIAIVELKKERYGKSRLYGSIGFMLVSVLIAKILDSKLILLHIYLFTIVITVIFAWLLVKHDTHLENKSGDNSSFSLKDNWRFWTSVFLMQLSFGAFYNFFTIFETSHGISLETTSLLWAFGVLCEIIMFYFQAPLLRNNLLSLIQIATILTAFRWLLVYLYPSNVEVMFLAQSLHALSFGLYHSAVISYLYTLYEQKRLAQQFLFGVSYGFGGFVGAILAGWFYGENLFLYAAIVAFVSYLMLVKLPYKKAI